MQLKKKTVPLVFLILTSLILISANIELTHNERLNDTVPTQLNTLHTIDTDWTTNWTMSSPAGTTIEVLGSYSGQTSVLHLNDSSGGTWATATHAFGRNISFGKVTVKVLVAQTTGQEVRIGVRSEGQPKASIRMRDDGTFEVEYGSTFNPLDNPTSYLGGVWYEVGIEFNCTSNTTKTFINGVEKSADVFQSNSSFMDALFITTTASGGPSIQGDYYIAWVDYSWITANGGTPPIPGFDLAYILLGILMFAGFMAFIRKRGQKVFLNYF